MRVAIVHDWLVTWRGGEKCLESILNLYPYAEVYTLFSTPGITDKYLPNNRVISSCLSKLPFVKKFYRFLFPFYPFAISDLSRKLSAEHKIKPYDLVLSISHCVAKNIQVPEGLNHVCYCLTPVRYIWDQFDNYFASKWYRPIVSTLRNVFKRWDVSSASGVTRFIAISDFVAQRIKDYYGRDSEVIYPPVSLGRFYISKTPKENNFYLMVNALVPYKRTEVVVEAFKRLKDKKLMVVGSGPEFSRLKAIAPANVEILGSVSDHKIEELYSNCKALIYPALEDFGIAPVEAQAAGRPVICLDRGGCRETVILSGSKTTGIPITNVTPEEIVSSIIQFEPLLEKGYFDPEFCRESALRFSEKSFINNLAKSISKLETRSN